MADGFGGFVSNVVNTGKELGNAVVSGLGEVGKFVVDVVKSDTKDALTAARSIGGAFGNPAASEFRSYVIGKGLQALGYDQLDKDTNPKNKSALEKAGAIGNTAINAASFVPGLGQGVKAAQSAMRSSRIISGGAKLIHEGSKVKGQSLIDLKTANTLLQKAADNVVPKSAKKKMQNAIADESLELLKNFKGNTEQLRKLLGKSGIDLDQYFGDPAKSAVRKVIKNFSANPDAAKQLRRAANTAMRQADFITHLGKVTAAKGLRVGYDALKHGYKAGSKQFVSHSANLWRKSGKDSEEKSTKQPVDHTLDAAYLEQMKKKIKKQY